MKIINRLIVSVVFYAVANAGELVTTQLVDSSSVDIHVLYKQIEAIQQKEIEFHSKLAEHNRLVPSSCVVSPCNTFQQDTIVRSQTIPLLKQQSLDLIKLLALHLADNTLCKGTTKTIVADYLCDTDSVISEWVSNYRVDQCNRCADEECVMLLQEKSAFGTPCIPESGDFKIRKFIQSYHTSPQIIAERYPELITSTKAIFAINSAALRSLYGLCEVVRAHYVTSIGWDHIPVVKISFADNRVKKVRVEELKAVFPRCRVFNFDNNPLLYVHFIGARQADSFHLAGTCPKKLILDIASLRVVPPINIQLSGSSISDIHREALASMLVYIKEKNAIKRSAVLASGFALMWLLAEAFASVPIVTVPLIACAVEHPQSCADTYRTFYQHTIWCALHGFVGGIMPFVIAALFLQKDCGSKIWPGWLSRYKTHNIQVN